MKQIIKDATHLGSSLAFCQRLLLFPRHNPLHPSPHSSTSFPIQQDVATCQRSNLTHSAKRGRLWQLSDEATDATGNLQAKRTQNEAVLDLVYCISKMK